MEVRRGELQEERVKVEAEVAVATAQLLVAPLPKSSGPPPSGQSQEYLPTHLTHLHRKLRMVQDQQIALETEVQMRPALALGCLCFVVIGCPVGIWFGKSDFLSSFITCFLPIVFVYYPLVLCGLNMAKSGHSLLLSVWAPNLLMGVIGVGMFWRLTRH
jgi:lipopolysaccharide export system permease protein